MKSDVIIRTLARSFLIPQIILFGFYVIAHGEGGPGGGFQGGVIIAAGFILHALLFGKEETLKIVPIGTLEILAPLGVMIYAGVGIACMVWGGKFLQYNILPFHDHHFAAEMGILGIEIGVGVTVASAIMLIFFELADKEND